MTFANKGIARSQNTSLGQFTLYLHWRPTVYDETTTNTIFPGNNLNKIKEHIKAQFQTIYFQWNKNIGTLQHLKYTHGLIIF